MIEVTNTKNFDKEKKLIEAYYQDTNHSFQLILDNPHQLILDNQSFSLNFKSPTYQRLIGPNHPLISAIGKQPKSILDGFGGLGKDGFILSHHGHKVTTYEINPILYLLLSQALENYSNQLDWTIHLGDVSKKLKGYDVIYLDPMFEINNSAKPKLAMQVIQTIVKDQSFNAWEQALRSTQRLVIKQHQSNPPIAALPEPSSQIKGKRNVRYDIYLN